MVPPRALTLLALVAAAVGADTDQHVLYDLTDEQYYSMPTLFELDDWSACRGTGGAYCVGTFELTPEGNDFHQLYDMMQRYSANWVDNFNHTLVHRGVCLQRRCAAHKPRARQGESHQPDLLTWFTTCVNATTTSAYNLSARLSRLQYCRASAADVRGPLSLSQRAFAVFVAIILAFTLVSTVLEVTLPDHAKKGAAWALSWSLQGSWRALHAAPPSASLTDLRCFDGLRVFTMGVVIVEHVTWITTHTYLSDTRTYEHIRRDLDVVTLANSTLVVQIFFMMSSFLLAHKLLQQMRREENEQPVNAFFGVMFNRIIRVSPSYFVVVWFAASWFERLGEGPMWEPLVMSEAAVCRQKWWTHLLYLNNVLYPDDKCLIQTWYLAADTQLYALCLLLTLTLRHWRRTSLGVLVTLVLVTMAAQLTLAHQWRLLPTLPMHRPESVRLSYRFDRSFNLMYQSPLANLPGALAGLLVAFIHHNLLDNDVKLVNKKVFSWISVMAVPAAVWWVGGSPLILGRGPPDRVVAAVLAVIERPVFALLVGIALLGAMNGVESSVRRVLSWPGWSSWARLSFGALLVHMPINKALVAARLAPSQLDRTTAIVEWFGVAALSYMAALVLALLVELPTQRLQRALTRAAPPAATPAPARPATPAKRDL